MERIKVLYIDDEQANLNAFKATYRRIFDIHLASSAEEGKKILEKNSIEVILSDQRMPTKSGVDFFESILETHPEPIRILLTAFSDINAVIDAINKGQVYRYITKPWNDFELKLTIENAYKLYVLKEQNDKITTKYIRVFKESSDPIILFDDIGRIIDYNKATIKMLKTKRSDLHFSTFYSFMVDKSQATQILKALEKNDIILDFDAQVRTRKGQVRDCLFSVNTIRDAYKKIIGYQAIIKDVTERTNMNKLLLKAIIDTQEKERERISRDLHDGLGQTLVALKLNIDSIKDAQEFNQDVYYRLEDLLESSIKQLREICYETLPSTLSELGLVKALDELKNRNRTDKLYINLLIGEDIPELEKPLQIAIYRISQEFINNTIKHGEASEIKIIMEWKNNSLKLNLWDNGKGFQIKDLTIYKGQGLKNIESRVKSFNGDVQFNSKENKGTEFNISFPINLN